MDAAFFTAFAKDKNINRAEFNAAWIKSHATKTEKPKIEFVGKTEEQKKVFKVLENYCNNFPCTPSNVILCGATGTGKTFAANLMKQSLQQKKVWVEYTTAFSMVNTFQKYVNSFGRDDEDLENFLNCEVLIIDDLGAEPIIKNVTQEHIYNIINERLYNGLAFIITTNLTPQQIMERYDQRIASRILSKENSTIIEFKGKDLRI
jgi:DNA replication protein DnaC